MLAFSHCRGRKFETCIAHQKIPNEIKHLVETLGAFFLVLGSMGLIPCDRHFQCVVRCNEVFSIHAPPHFF
jgi:hypothetical protein